MAPTVFQSQAPQSTDSQTQTPPEKKRYTQWLKDSVPTTNPLAAFSPKPAKFSFESQDSDEQVLLLLRAHPITNIPWIFTTILMFIGPTMLLPLLPLFEMIPGKYQAVIFLVWYLLTIAYALEKLLDWLFNVYIITDERIVDTDFYSLIYKRISETQVDHIQDVTSETGGVLRSIFDFGTLKIQTAGTQDEFEFEDVPHPAMVSQLLNEAIEQEDAEHATGKV